MLANTLVALLFLAAGITAYPSTIKREDTIDDGEIQLYAYGAGISGLQVYGGPDGRAYIATQPSDNLTELIWPPPTVDAPWNATAANNNTSEKASASFYILGDSDAFEPAGFQRSNETAPAGANMKGFTKFGSQIMWTKGETLMSQFWASNTTEDGVYILNWNGNGASRTDSVPVTIKTTAPADI